MIPKGMLPYPLFVAVKPSLSASASWRKKTNPPRTRLSLVQAHLDHHLATLLLVAQQMTYLHASLFLEAVHHDTNNQASLMRSFVLIEFSKSSGTREQQNLPSSQTLQEGCGDLVVSSGRQSELCVNCNGIVVPYNQGNRSGTCPTSCAHKTRRCWWRLWPVLVAAVHSETLRARCWWCKSARLWCPAPSASRKLGSHHGRTNVESACTAPEVHGNKVRRLAAHAHQNKVDFVFSSMHACRSAVWRHLLKVVLQSPDLHYMVVLMLREAERANPATLHALQTEEIAFAFVRVHAVNLTRREETRRQQWLQPPRLHCWIVAVSFSNPYRTSLWMKENTIQWSSSINSHGAWSRRFRAPHDQNGLQLSSSYKHQNTCGSIWLLVDIVKDFARSR
jgi:hypothetical protein